MYNVFVNQKRLTIETLYNSILIRKVVQMEHERLSHLMQSHIWPGTGIFWPTIPIHRDYSFEQPKITFRGGPGI